MTKPGLVCWHVAHEADGKGAYRVRRRLWRSIAPALEQERVPPIHIDCPMRCLPVQASFFALSPARSAG